MMMVHNGSFSIVSVFFTWIQMAKSIADGVDCTYTSLNKKENNCMDTHSITDYTSSGLPNLLFGESLANFCRNAPDAIPCLKEAFEPCRDPYYNFQSYNRTFSMVCDNKKVYMNAEGHCFETLYLIQQCFKEYAADVRKVGKIAQMTDKLRCLILNSLRDCLHVNESSECTHEYSTFLTSLYQGRFTSETCDVYTESLGDTDWYKYTISTEPLNNWDPTNADKTSGAKMMATVDNYSCFMYALALAVCISNNFFY